MNRLLSFSLPFFLVSTFLMVSACEQSTSSKSRVRTGVSVHVGYGRGPFWGWGGYYPRPPEIEPPLPEVPIDPDLPIAVPLPEPDFGGDLGGGDFGGFDGGGFDF
ncbi:MAG: hypothetical protein ACR2O2_11090 [Ruegeria sp.]